MTAAEYEAFRARVDSGYADANVASGAWPAEGALERATAQTDALLPDGLESDEALLLSARTPEGELAGHLWIGLRDPEGDPTGAWIYDIEVLPALRGRGYGRVLLAAAEEHAASHGRTSVLLNVIAANRVARDLYERSGYSTTSIWMRKDLRRGK